MPNELVSRLAVKKNLDVDYLQRLWDDSAQEQTIQAKNKDEKDRSSKKYWQAVKSRFLKKVDELNVMEAKLIMDAREKYQSMSGQFLDAINNNDYVKAKEIFPQVVQAKTEILINNQRRAFLKNYAEQVKEAHKDR
jgi:hypothetical protein